MRRLIPVIPVVIVLLFVTSVAHAQPLKVKATPPPVPATVVDVSLKIEDEIAPPGTFAQMKVFITEPKPITTGGARFAFDAFDSIVGISLSSPRNDGFGFATFGTDKTVAVSFVSPSATLGLEFDYPILAFVGKVPDTAQMGATIPVGFLGGLEFFDPAGNLYTSEFKPGTLTIGQAVTIHDVLPGSATLPAGSTVTVKGGGFNPDTRLRVEDFAFVNPTFVSPQELQVTLPGPVDMHGARIRLVGRDRAQSKVEYFSYQRTVRQQGSESAVNPLLNSVMPLFPKTTVTTALLDINAATAGIAIQNIAMEGTAEVSFEWVATTDTGKEVATPAGSTTVGASQFIVRDLSELVTAAPSATAVLRVTSPAPIQAMGLSFDATGKAVPQIPR